MSTIERALAKIQAERNGAAEQEETLPPKSERRASADDIKSVDISIEDLHEAHLTPRAGDGVIDIRRHFQSIKRPLINNALDTDLGLRRANMIIVTSPLPDAGKTFVSTNLAVSIGLERDKGVILVDGDVAHRHLTRTLGLDTQPGLMDALVDPTKTIGNLVLDTKVKGVRLLPAGSSQPDATELLASNRMASIANDLASLYMDEIIVWDSPPLLITNEAAVLASFMGQVVVVVEAGVTSKASVHDALQLLSQVKGDRAVNLVLNKTTQAFLESSYGGYGGTYGYHSEYST